MITGVAVVFLTTLQGSKTGPQTSIWIGLIAAYSDWIIGVSAFLILLSVCSAASGALKKAATQEALRREEEVEKQARLAREETQRKAKEQQETAEHERRRRPYVLEPVEQLDPHKAPYIHQYIKETYLPREADEAARQALRAAMNRTGGAPLSICVFGRPMLGKTSLAFETMCAELTGWTLVHWSHGIQPEELDFAIQQHTKLVFWLDDLNEYASQTEAPMLLDLPRRFETPIRHLVIIATCRDGEEQTRVQTTLGSLLERLTPVYPTTITERQADALTADVARAGLEAQRQQFDGTPGSLLLGVNRMLWRYKQLGKETQRLLLAMKLLRSAGIYSYPVPRVRSTAVNVFHMDAQQWQEALEQSVIQGFLRPETLAVGDEGTPPACREGQTNRRWRDSARPHCASPPCPAP